MFGNLSDRLIETFKNLRSKGKLSPADIDATLREIRRLRNRPIRSRHSRWPKAHQLKIFPLCSRYSADPDLCRVPDIIAIFSQAETRGKRRRYSAKATSIFSRVNP